MQNAVRMRHIAMCGLSGSTIFFAHYLKKKLHDFGGGKKSYRTQNVCFDFLYNFCLKHFSLLGELSETCSKMSTGLHVKYTLFLPCFNEIWILSTGFRKNAQVSNFTTIRLMGVKLLQADRRTVSHNITDPWFLPSLDYSVPHLVRNTGNIGYEDRPASLFSGERVLSQRIHVVGSR